MHRELPEPRRMRPALACGLTLLALSALAAPEAHGAARWLVEGLLDAEVQETDPDSRLLSENGGDPQSSGALRLWAGAELHPRLQLMVLGEFEDTGSGESGVEAEIEQAFLRYSFGGSRSMFVEAGRIITPIGDFGGRYLSTLNPLIGAPTGYEVSYPLGVQFAGSVSLLDFRAAVIDSPVTNPTYVPGADRVARPALALGVTPFVGLRLGGYYTRGPYLNEKVEAVLPAGADWKSFAQEIVGAESQFSRGHFDVHVDYNVSTYEVPTYDGALQGNTAYVEPKYTWSPRFYTALRVESNEYVYAKPYGAFWVGSEVRVDDVEIGAGYRFGRDTLLKLSYRFDDWVVDAADEAFFKDGYSVALQLSQAFDVRDWFEAPR